MVNVMFSSIYVFLFFINYTVALQDLAIESHFKNTKTLTDNILCRDCGINVSSSNDIISKPSTASQKSVYDSLYGKKNVLIQVLVSDIFFQLPVISTQHSSCVGVGEWSESDSWYPHYRWRPCICPECGSYVGWVFEPMDFNWANKPTFYNLILTNIVGESFVDSLMQYPEVFEP